METKWKRAETGSELVRHLESWFGGYMSYPNPDAALVVALWVIGTWVYRKFYAFPYLLVTGRTKGCGKTRQLELIRPLVKNPMYGTSWTPANIIRKLAALDGDATMLWDESEVSARDTKDFMSAVLNAGYRKGGSVSRVVSNQSVDFDVFCPKALAQIGDPTGTVRERSIPIFLEKGDPKREFFEPEVMSEAEGLLGEMGHVLNQLEKGKVVPIYPAFLEVRDKEIWGALFGVAAWLGLHRKDVERLERYASDVWGSKQGKRVRVHVEEDEDEAASKQFAGRALRDLVAVLKDGETVIPTVEAVVRLRAIPTSPWRTFKGAGVDAIVLADLLGRFNVQPKQRRVGGGVGHKVNPVRGYLAADLRAALTATGGKL